MGIRHVNKSQKRVVHARSEYGEYSGPWHRKGEWCAYVKRQHSKALRGLGRALVRDGIEQMDPRYVVTVPRGTKSAETKRRRTENWNAYWAFHEANRLKQGLPAWHGGADWNERLSPYRAARRASYQRLCRARRTAYWRQFVC